MFSSIHDARPSIIHSAYVLPHPSFTRRGPPMPAAEPKRRTRCTRAVRSVKAAVFSFGPNRHLGQSIPQWLFARLCMIVHCNLGSVHLEGTFTRPSWPRREDPEPCCSTYRSPSSQYRQPIERHRLRETVVSPSSFVCIFRRRVCATYLCW